MGWDWIVLLPPIIAIVLALWTRQVYLSLITGLWIGTTILGNGNPLTGLQGMADALVDVFSSPSNTRIIIFSTLVGGLIALVQVSGGVAAFALWVQSKGWGRSRRSAELLAWFIGIVIFVESSITSLIVGTLSRPFFDKLRLPREKLAYYCDATSAPVCMAIPLNGWGAFVLGLLFAQGYEGDAVGLLVASIPFNLYSWLAIAFTLVLALTGWSFGSMRRAEQRAAETGAVNRPGSTPMIADEITELTPVRPEVARATDLLIPVGIMISMIFVGLYITGEGNLMEGSGSTSVLWGVGAAIGVAILLYFLPRQGAPLMGVGQSTEFTLKGASGLIGVVGLLVLAFALGDVSRELKMGDYMVRVLGGDLPVWWVPALVFVLGCVVSFTLGSSWTAFAILMPLTLPLAEALGIAVPLMLGAVLSGGIYGDHASPLSDTSIISSMAAACDHVDHINTQLPYTLVVGGLTALGFLVAGLVA
ncbi:MAG: sodium:proton antiporter [Bacteroidota bacterium]|nr:sodium:proton antiporter [Bacteroidota bacterium]MDE2833362.1 sodium:proton antiporter [Bacteroidota bacterium]MDE2957390.1 sodium:proton antiporter [Bacteroidota bacterium]